MSSTKRILLLEDNTDTLAFMARLLIREGYSVSPATTCAEAFNIAKKIDFDLLISDIVVVDGDGRELLKSILSFQSIKAIAVTGLSGPTEQRRIKEAGFGKLLVKPVDVPELLKAIAAVLNTPDHTFPHEEPGTNESHGI